MHMNMTEVFGQEDFTIVKNPGKENLEIISKEGKKINTYKPSGQKEEDNEFVRSSVCVWPSITMFAFFRPQ